MLFLDSSLDNLLDFSSNSNNNNNTTNAISAEAESERKTVVATTHRAEKIGDVIRKELKWGFILHTYGFGCLFFILAFYTFFSILNLR